MRVGPKKNLIGHQNTKNNQNLSNGGESLAGSQLAHSQNAFRNNIIEGVPKAPSPPPNMDLESIINNTEAYFKSQRGKQKPRQLPTLQNLESLTDYNVQFQKQLLHAQALSSTSQVTYQGGNLKYHMIRKLLEEANPTELAQIVQLQQIQQALMLQQQHKNNSSHHPSTKQSFSPQHRTISHSKSPKKVELGPRLTDQVQSSKDLLRQTQGGSMLQGESLLIEDNNQQLKAMSRLTNQLSHSKSNQLSKGLINREISAEIVVRTDDAAKKNFHLNIKEEEAIREGGNKHITTPYIGEQLNTKNQKFKIKISSNSRDSKDMIVGVSLQKDPSKERSLSNSKQLEKKQNHPMSVTQGPLSFINHSLLHKSQIERKDLNKVQQLKQQTWENTLCVQIRQLPIYSKDGTAIPLQQFVSTDVGILPKTSSKNRSPDSKTGKHFYPAQFAPPSKMKHLDQKYPVAIANLQNSSAGMTTNRFLTAQQVQYQSNPATALGAALNYNKEQYTSSRQRRQKMSMTNKEDIKKGVVLNDPSTKTLGPFEVDKERSFDKIEHRHDVTPPPGNQQSPTPISQLGHTIKVPHIEFQRDFNKKTQKMQKQSPIKHANDTSPTRLHYEKRKTSENKPVPPILKDLKQQSQQNSIVLANNQYNSLNSKRNSYFPLQPQKEQQSLGQANFGTSISQNSLVQIGIDALPMYSVINHTSSELDHNQSLINQTSTILQSKNTKSPPVGSILNNNEYKQSNHPSERRDSIVVLNVINKGGHEKSPSRDIDDSSPSMQLENQESRDEDYLAPGYIDIHEQNLPMPAIQDQSRDDSDMRSTIDVHGQTINDTVNSLEQNLAQVILETASGFQFSQDQSKLQQPSIILPSLQRKKYPVSFQQQLHETSASTRDIQIKAIVKKENTREAVERDKKANELRETKYNQMINCFERLQKNMKNRNFNCPQTKQVSTMGNFNNYYEASKFMSTDYFNSIFPHDSSGASVQHLNEAGSNLLISTSETGEQSHQNAIPGLIPSNDTRFFKALQKQMVFTPQFQQETKLMMKTKQQMKQVNMTQAEKMKTKILGMKACPFKVVKNGISLQQQQRQLSRILEVPEIEMIEQVPFLKQTCLVEYVKDQWSSVFQGPSVMKDYQYFCLYYPAKFTYKLIIFGLESPLSNCCHQLIVFHFSKIQPQPEDSNKLGDSELKSLLQVFCSDPVCSQYPLFEKVVSSKSFVDSILNTPNGPPLPLYVASTVPQLNPTFAEYRPLPQNYRMSKTNRSRQNNYSVRPSYQQQQLFNTSRDREYGGINSINGSIFERGQQQPGPLINSESFDDEEYHLESIQYLKGTQAYDRAGFLQSDPRTIFEQSLSVSSAEQRKNIPHPYAQSKQTTFPQAESSFRGSKESTLDGQRINDISINKYLNRVKSDFKPPVV